MTISEDLAQGAQAKADDAPLVHRIDLTKADFSAALSACACQRLGIEGSFDSNFCLKFKPDGELDCVEVELTPIPFVEGAPIWSLNIGDETP